MLNLIHSTLLIVIIFTTCHVTATTDAYNQYYQNLIEIDFLNKKLKQYNNPAPEPNHLQSNQAQTPYNYKKVQAIKNNITTLNTKNVFHIENINHQHTFNYDHNYSTQYFTPKHSQLETTDTQTFLISHLNNYSPLKANGFYYKNNFSNKIKINFRLKEFPGIKSKYKVNIHCSGPFQQNKILGIKQAKKSGNTYTHKSSLFPDKDLYNYKLELNQSTGDCVVKLKGHSTPISFFLKPEINYLKQLELPSIQSLGLCNSPGTLTYTSSVQTYFHKLSGNYTSCTSKLKSIKSIPNGLSSLQERIKALLGQEIPYELLEKFDQDLSNFNLIDFSKAPNLDAIFISSLVFIDDLIGNILLKLLDYHAQKGTQIRILVSNKTAKKKDDIALYNFQDKYHNVQFKLLTIRDSESPKTFKKALNSRHRVNHVKTFITYSKSVPHNNFAILGGRNIRNIYFLKNLPANNDEIHYDDFEYSINSQELVKTLAHQFLKLWSYYEPSFYVKPTHIHYYPKQSTFSYDPNQIYIKNQISYPAINKFKLEDDFAKLFDSARESLTIITPYLHLTPKLSKSIFTAVDRGVKIKIVTNLNLNGDSFGGFLTTINGKSVNELFENISLYEYTKQKHLLHAKLILVDNELSVLGSVNLNQRSFFHDTELVSYILSTQYFEEVNSIAEQYYFADSPLIERKVSPNAFYKMIIKLIPDIF